MKSSNSERFEKLEKQIFRQEHRLFTLLKRVLLQKGTLSDEHWKASVEALLWRLLPSSNSVFWVPILALYLTYNANDLFEQQNVQIKQQTILLEAERRSAVIFESGNVLDAVGRELAEPENINDSLSNALIGRIVALSKTMKPYKYLDPDTDNLTKRSLSPERGHLLISLHESRLDSNTYIRINSGAFFRFAELDGVNLRYSNLRYANLQGSNFYLANLQGVNLQEAMLQEANFALANLQGADLQNANLKDADLRHANLQEANLQEARLRRANLQGVNLQEAMLQEANLIYAKIQEADLPYADLTWAQLTFANIQGSNLRNAVLQGAYLHNAVLQGAKLRGAKLQQADLFGANLQDADLRGADLCEAILLGADLRGSILLGADLTKSFAHENQKESFAKVMTEEQLNSIIYLDDLEFDKFIRADITW